MKGARASSGDRVVLVMFGNVSIFLVLRRAVVARRSCTENEQEMLVLMALAVTTTTRFKLRVVAAVGATTTTTSISGGGGGSGLGDDNMVSAVVWSEFEAAMKNEHEK